MNMVEKEKDLIGFAHKVISFRMNVIKACKAKGITPPTDEQISDYINDYGLHFEDFMADFTEHEGMFRCLKTPLEQFVDDVNKMPWGKNQPSSDEIEKFFNKNGNNISLFCQQVIVSKMKPLERKIYLKTIETLPTEGLVLLWNLFIEESGLCENYRIIHFDKYPKDEIDNEIRRIITEFWGEIFKQVMVFPTSYEHLFGNEWGMNYFDEIVWPIVTKEIGIDICTETNEMEYIEKNS